ncbi:histone-like protein [Methanobrevibacter arboriphilus]|uniref:histone-like protein n=1 Tax=Methanobrevibacter arboriphilus TaxID=39441 RepID=UPI0006D16D1A|nr:histone-like protein [Methanobrevibacter arboriphilus]
MTDLPKATVKRMIKEVNDELLISNDGLNQIIEETTEFIKKLTEESFKSAKSNKRKTIKTKGYY